MAVHSVFCGASYCSTQRSTVVNASSFEAFLNPSAIVTCWGQKNFQSTHLPASAATGAFSGIVNYYDERETYCSSLPKKHMHNRVVFLVASGTSFQYRGIPVTDTQKKIYDITRARCF